MTISVDYLNWLYDQFGDFGYPIHIFKMLSEIEFRWQMELDSNRASAGLILREQFALEQGVYQDDVADGPCSVLEMMCALAEDMYSQCSQESPRAFMDMMLYNLMVETNIDYNELPNQVNIWMNRDYKPNGYGSIFYIPKSLTVDMRKLDIWGQMTVYLNYKYPLDVDFLKK